jgi:GNAT superfamily N-acetyltransferase
MKIIELNEFNDNKYYELLKKIDIGEYRIVTNSENYKEFEKWVFKYGLELENNYGIVTAFIYNKNLRIQCSFSEDINQLVVKELVKMINKAIDVAKCDQLNIWCNNHTNLVSLLGEHYNFEPHVYMSHEFHYDYNHFNYTGIDPLVVVEYEEKYLNEVLNLLEMSFVNIAQTGEFLSYKDFYHQKFMSTEKKTCEVFLLDIKVIGMYAQDNGDVEYIAVLPEYQSYGYGSKILNHALNTMKNIIDRTPFLYCVDSNHRANEFYKREGWIVTGRAAWLQLKLSKDRE